MGCPWVGQNESKEEQKWEVNINFIEDQFLHKNLSCLSGCEST